MRKKNSLNSMSDFYSVYHFRILLNPFEIRSPHLLPPLCSIWRNSTQHFKMLSNFNADGNIDCLTGA